MNTIIYVVTKIERDEKGQTIVHAQDADETKKKRRKLSSPVLDPTSYFVGQKVRPVLEDAS